MKSREQKQTEADERNARWNMLSREDKIRYLYMRPGKCRKQLHRLGVAVKEVPR